MKALRCAEDCLPLTETNDLIHLIGRKTDMLNVSSFIRNFKQQTGLTPGQYRSRNEKNNTTQRGENQMMDGDSLILIHQYIRILLGCNGSWVCFTEKIFGSIIGCLYTLHLLRKKCLLLPGIL